jgi:hypothetical protein
MNCTNPQFYVDDVVCLAKDVRLRAFPEEIVPADEPADELYCSDS